MIMKKTDSTTKARAAGSSAPACSPHPLAIECVQLKDRLGRAGLYRTMQAMEDVVKAVGWELAENAAVSGAAEPRTLDGRDYCLGCRRELMTESGHVCPSCADAGGQP